MTPEPQTPPWVRWRERELAALATRQHGVVARRQLVSLGFGEEAIKVRLAAGRLAELHRGVYAVGHRRMSQRGWWWAAVLAYGDSALLSHRSAASLFGFMRPRGPIDVTAPLGRQGIERRTGIWLHRGRIHVEEVTVQDGFPVTTVARTLFDLAEFAPFHQLRSAWEEADRLKLLQLNEIERVCDRGRGRRALRPTRRLLAELSAPHGKRSPLEDRFAEFCEASQLPPPVTNVLVLGREVDVLWPRARLIVELDSFEFHAHRAAFERDRARDTRLLIAGYRTIRVTHRRLDEPRTLAAEIRELLDTSTQTSVHIRST